MRADREKRAVILTAQGQRQAAILTAEGSKQSQILNAEGDRESQILRAQADREASDPRRAQGEGQAIQTVFQAIHDGQPDQSGLAYQYLQMMPKIAEGSANKVWVDPLGDHQGDGGPRLLDPRDRRAPPREATPRTRVDMGPSEPSAAAVLRVKGSTNKAVEEAIAEAEWEARRPPRPRRCRRRSTRPSTPPVDPAPADIAGAPRRR